MPAENETAVESPDGLKNDSQSHDEQELLRLAETGDADKIDSLLEGKELNLDAEDSKGMTALAIAVKNERVEAVSKLLKYRPGLYIPDKNGMTAFHWAAKNGDSNMMGTLLQENHKITTSETTTGSKSTDGGEPSSDAGNEAGGSNTGDPTAEDTHDVKKKRTQVGLNIDLLDLEHKTPLYLASESGSVETVRKLLEHGADERLQDTGMRTPIDIAALAGKQDVIGELSAEKWNTGGLGVMPAYCLFPNFVTLHKELNFPTLHEGTLDLGALVAGPKSMNPLPKQINNPLFNKDHIYGRKLSGFKVSLTEAKTGRYGPWAKAMAKRLAPKLNQTGYNTIKVDNIETKFFYPSQEYRDECMKMARKENPDYSRFASIYVVTGMKIAHGACLTKSPLTNTEPKRAERTLSFNPLSKSEKKAGDQNVEEQEVKVDEILKPDFVLAVCLWRVSSGLFLSRMNEAYGYPKYMIKPSK
ncbi:ankyrin [Daldinia caldariorum]|uniref:ankyrin n=1 Tax=Daldinia caldariorum TaxID=326644 RepID=UPI0020086BF6|nr:ankyrin [Daldinia caldariorum]KAI1467514.1 ankyrin [Daldinia caldariorum]